MKDLRPNPRLLNHKFNGYKLAPTKLEDASLSLLNPVHEASHEGNQYSYLYTRCRGMHNHLYHDTYNSAVYFIDAQLNVTTLLHNMNNIATELYTVTTVPSVERKFSGLSSNLLFPCETLAVICDGSGAVYVAQTGHRKKDEKQDWGHVGKPVHDFDRPSSLVSSRMDRDVLHLLAFTLEARKGDAMVCVFHWLQIKLNFENPPGSCVKGVKRFLGKDFPNAVWLSKDFTQLLVATSKRFHLVDEDLEKIEPPPSESVGGPKIYEWTQTKEFITIGFNLCVTENEIECHLSHNSVTIKLKNGRILLEGSTEKEILFDASRWYVERNKLEVVLIKKTEGEFWNDVVPTDKSGDHVIEGEEAARIQEIGESLSHLTSENGAENPPQDQASQFNMAQLEECDQYGEEDMKLYSVDVFTGEVVMEKNFAGHQWLFTHSQSSLHQGAPPRVCLRHDVDGVLWQPPGDNNTQWEHAATFDAFGFVHASKQNSKYTLCSTDFKYAVITDCTSQLYVYAASGPDPSQHPQYVHGLVGSNRIVGCEATDSHLYVLTDQHLNIISLP